MRRLIRCVCVLGAVAAQGAAAWAAGGNPNPGVLPVRSHAFGKTYAEWSAAWWQWALAIDGHVNPIEDPDGRFASTGQSGHVWFLAGTSSTAGGQLVVRHVTIPAGKAIFFPILNTIWVTVPFLGDPLFSEPGAEQAARDAIALDPTVDRLELEIDGKPLKDLASYRVESTVFTAFLPDYNMFDVFGFDLPEGTYPDCVADGYWILLAPLSKGRHTIHFRGETGYGFVTEVLYYLTIR